MENIFTIFHFFSFSVEPCGCCFTQLTRLRSPGISGAQGPWPHSSREGGASAWLKGRLQQWGRGAHGCHTQPGSLTFMEMARLVLPSPFLPVPLLVSVGLDIFGFHRDHKKLQQQFYTRAWLKQNLGSCGCLADKPTLAQCSQMLLRTFPGLV